MRKATLISFAALSATAVLLAGCDSKKDDIGDPPKCATATAPTDAKADWTFKGATGEIKVVAPTEEHAPGVTVAGPFTVADTTPHTLAEGTGDKIKLEDTVSVCYHGVNGADGSVFDSAYQRGEPTDFPLNGVVPGFQKAIVGQKKGAKVAVAVSPADGYPNGTPDGSIKPGQTLIFVLQIKDVQTA
ncbi:MAG: FKBP-type peptidyl-prolyl cis-trans isomerase [Gordonia sp. (in: high G+C Gram-positive bacteria)]|uniref:FKBP-type peptidyl-prolyl cis-trans isomerase n=1 Tax=Gordonia sp. (in: high G+C Gram-positive bacteria) TaxID=84139 RepID=UPI0039E39970